MQNREEITALILQNTRILVISELGQGWVEILYLVFLLVSGCVETDLTSGLFSSL